MAYIVFHFETRQIIKHYASRKGALVGLRAANRNAGYPQRWTLCNYDVDHGALREWCETADGSNGYAPYAAIESNLFDQHYRRNITVTNLMTGKPVEIDSNTPWSCRPDSEAYWSN